MSYEDHCENLAAVLSALLLAVAAAVAVTWAPDRPLSELEARWAQPPSTFVQVQGMSVQSARRRPARRSGSHRAAARHLVQPAHLGRMGAGAKIEPARDPVRSARHRLTGAPPDADYRIERYVRFVADLLDQLGVSRCALAGNSFGGQVAWETALAHPERVEKLILVDAAGYPFQPVSVPIGFRIARIPLLNRLMQYTLPRRLIESSVRNVYGDPGKVTAELVDRYFELTLREGNRRALVARFAQAQAGIRPDRIAALKVPTLILWGGRDRLIPPGDAEKFHRDIAGSRLIVFDRLGTCRRKKIPRQPWRWRSNSFPGSLRRARWPCRAFSRQQLSGVKAHRFLTD